MTRERMYHGGSEMKRGGVVHRSVTLSRKPAQQDGGSGFYPGARETITRRILRRERRGPEHSGSVRSRLVRSVQVVGCGLSGICGARRTVALRKYFGVERGKEESAGRCASAVLKGAETAFLCGNQSR